MLVNRRVTPSSMSPVPGTNSSPSFTSSEIFGVSFFVLVTVLQFVESYGIFRIVEICNNKVTVISIPLLDSR